MPVDCIRSTLQNRRRRLVGQSAAPDDPAGRIKADLGLTTQARPNIVLLMSSTIRPRDERAPAAPTGPNARSGLAALLLGDGRPALALGAVGLIAAGAFAFFLSASGEFLPHDVAWLGLSAAELRSLADGRVADFMFHDRVAFGGTLIAVGVLYLWLVVEPLARREAWAWWLVAASAVLGFASFLSWLGFGYLDTWHAVATGILLPLFIIGLARTRHQSPGGPLSLIRSGRPLDLRSTLGLGRGLLLLAGFGMLVAGTTILTIGTFVVFVPQDLMFIGFDRAALDAMNPRLVPLIAHDRSGFGGGLATAGLVVLGVVWAGRPSRALWQALMAAGVVGFGAAIGIHALVGYLDASHVGPAVLGAVVFAGGIGFARRGMLDGREDDGQALGTLAGRPADGFALSDEPVRRGRRTKDLAVDPDQDAADRLAPGRALPLRHADR
jgi:hypothetical protein